MAPVRRCCTSLTHSVNCLRTKVAARALNLSIPGGADFSRRLMGRLMYLTTRGRGVWLPYILVQTEYVLQLSSSTCKYMDGECVTITTTTYVFRILSLRQKLCKKFQKLFSSKRSQSYCSPQICDFHFLQQTAHFRLDRIGPALLLHWRHTIFRRCTTFFVKCDPFVFSCTFGWRSFFPTRALPTDFNLFELNDGKNNPYRTFQHSWTVMLQILFISAPLYFFNDN